MQQAHVADFAGFDIEFDNYGSTNSPENREVCDEIWAAIRKAGLVEEQAGDAALRRRRPARSWPIGSSKEPARSASRPDQYGDSCDKCGAHYSPTDLIDPVSTLSGSKPEIRKADHLFVNIEKLHGFLEEWTQSGEHLQPEIANYLKGHFLGEPLHDWDVSRPAPYFGFEIPDSPGNYWYVWFDAPIGYIGSTQQWCKKHGEKLDDWWRNDEKTEIHHFIGKDITYFHTLFWPAMLKTGRLQPAREGPHPRLPDRQRREDVEEQGDVHPGVDLPGASRPVVPAILLRLEAVVRRGRHRPELRRFHRQGQCRPGGQGREHRQPHGAVRREDGAAPTSRRAASCSPRRPRRRGDRRGLRHMRLQPGDAADHGRRRSGQRVHRIAQAVGTGQEGRPAGETRRRRSSARSA